MSTADFLEKHVEDNLDRLLDKGHAHVVVYVHHTVPDLAFVARYKTKAHYYGDRYYWWANNYVLHVEHNL